MENTELLFSDLMRRILIITLIILLIDINLVSAANSLTVQKTIENQDIKIGDDVKIILKINNPFDKDIRIKIVDKNIFGNNGIDVQCLEYSIPSKKEVAVAYDPIKPFTSGKFTLNSAQVTYTNPETNKEETVKSNDLDVTVKSSNAQQGQAQGITTIYRCNGMNIQSTSYSSSGSSFNVQIGSNTNQQPTQPSNSPQDRVQNNQLNQNTNALKQEMENQLQKQKEMEKEFQKNLANNNEFQKQHQSLLNSGYNLTKASFNVENNNTGSFELTYQKQNETVSMKGKMDNGTLKNMMVLTEEDKQKMFSELQKNKQFQEYNQQLIKQGFNQTNPSFTQISQNYTKITVPYSNQNEQKEITADFINGTIKNVYFEDDNDRTNIWWFLLLIPIFGIIIWMFYKKLSKKPKKIIETKKDQLKIEKPIDYLKEAKNMLEQAKKLFDEKKEKDAYEKVSQAIRLYFSYDIGLRKEMTNSDLLSHLKKSKKNIYSEIKKCLDLCTLVEFAKYKPNKEDFKKIIQIAQKIIGG